MDAVNVDDLSTLGFAFLRGVFSSEQLDAIAAHVDAIPSTSPGRLAGAETFAIRQVMKHAPGLAKHVWNDKLKAAAFEVVGHDAFVSKSIWFDKPAGGNWFVAFHQDISIHVEGRMEASGFSRWTRKHGLLGVVPPVHVVERTLTFRIHLDDATAENGALRVLPATHRCGILREAPGGAAEVDCPMRAGDVMLMRPLLFHSSMRSVTNAPRRVLHLEVTDIGLVQGLQWAEIHAIG